MNLKSLAAICALAGLLAGNAAQAATVSFLDRTLVLNNPPTEVYDIATMGSQTGAQTDHFYQLIVNPSWAAAGTTRFTNFAATPEGSVTTYALFTDTDASLTSSNTGTTLISTLEADSPGNNLIPFFEFLLTAGQYVLQIHTAANQTSASTHIAAVPLPGAMWLFGSALLAFLGMSARRKL